MAEIFDFTTGEKRLPQNSLEEAALALDAALTQADDGPIEEAVDALMKELKKPLQLRKEQVDLLMALTDFHKTCIKAETEEASDKHTFLPSHREQLYEKLGQAFPEIL